jgi:uncharacterized protein
LTEGGIGDDRATFVSTGRIPFMKKHYFFKLIPPRPTFVQDMSEHEKLLMSEHGRYTHANFAVGKVLLYGPVMAKDVPFGVAILEVEDESEARQFSENDPSVRAGLNRFEFYPMQIGGAPARQS